MSMVRFLVYCNQFDVEGLVADDVDVDEEPRAAGRAPDARRRVRRRSGRTDQARAGLSDRGRIARGGRVRAARLRHGRRRPGQDVARRRADPRRPRTRDDPRPLWVLAWGGANTLAQALLHAQGDADARRRSTRSSRSCASTRSPIRTTPGRGSGASFPRCTTSASRRPQDGEEYYLATWTGISGDRFYKNAPGADFSDVHRRLGEREHPQQGTARQALSDAVLHPRGGHAVVPGPDRQRAGELHEPGLRRMGRPLCLAHVPTARRGRSGRRAATRIPGRDSSRDTVIGIDGRTLHVGPGDDLALAHGVPARLRGADGLDGQRRRSRQSQSGRRRERQRREGTDRDRCRGRRAGDARRSRHARSRRPRAHATAGSSIRKRARAFPDSPSPSVERAVRANRRPA